MPVWVQVVGAITAIIALAAGLWSKVLRPGARLISATEEMLPLIKDLTKTFADVPHAFSVLEEIVAQFRTNSGSSLRDAINRIEEAAKAAYKAGEILKVQVEVVRELSAADRRQLERLVTLLNYLDAKVTIGSDAVKRMEESAAGVAWDLEAAHLRADQVESDAKPGAAADAAAQRGDAVTPVDRVFEQERRQRDEPVEYERRKIRPEE